MRWKFSTTVIGVLPLLNGCVMQAPDEDTEPAEQELELAGNIRAEGSFTCDFGLPAGLPPEVLPPAIERDRAYQSARPGFERKQIPFRIDVSNGGFQSGGRYLFETFSDAKSYQHWLQNDYVLDGVKFFDRPIFLNPDCHAWRVIGASNFADVASHQFVVRVERLMTPARDQSARLVLAWYRVARAARSRGLTGVWLTYNAEERLVQLVSFGDRIAPPSPTELDFASLAALENAPPLGDSLGCNDYLPSFDRTSWVLTYWRPFERGDHGDPSVWPQSPPLPAPFCGDGVCEVSRGESHGSCSADCPSHCGDGVCGNGETTLNCPGDCRHFQ